MGETFRRKRRSSDAMDRGRPQVRGLLVDGNELASHVSDIRLGDVGEPGGLDQVAGFEPVMMREPAATGILRAIRAKARLRPDRVCVDGLGELDDAGKLSKRAEGVDKVGMSGRTPRALLGELVVSPFTEPEVVGSGSAFRKNGEAGPGERLRNIARGPIDQEDGVDVLENFSGVHDKDTLTLCEGKVNSVGGGGGVTARKVEWTSPVSTTRADAGRKQNCRSIAAGIQRWNRRAPNQAQE